MLEAGTGQLQSGTRTDIIADIAPVINGGYCVGCGACAVVAPDLISMRRNSDGAVQAHLNSLDQVGHLTSPVCPFSNSAANEDDIGKIHFGSTAKPDPHLGYFLQSWAGYCAEGAVRERGSSGGMTSWIALELLKRGFVDAVVHVHPFSGTKSDDVENDLFAYSISRSPDEIEQGSKTRYYSVSMDAALREIRATRERIAFVGVPCFIKAVRNLMIADPIIKDCVQVTIALFCGHMKSSGFAESLAWQLGVPPKDIDTADFRVKRPGHSAKAYGFSVSRKSAESTLTAPMSEMAGRRWDGGYFKLKACDYCDDVVGETADVSLGDAWLPEFDGDPAGTNVVVVRDPRIASLIEDAIAHEKVSLTPLDPERVIASQAAGFRDRRGALAYRLWLADKRKVWRPTKRITPSVAHLSYVRRITYSLRAWVRIRSFASLRFCKRVKSILPYRVEMTLYHAAFRIIGILEARINALSTRKALSN